MIRLTRFKRLQLDPQKDPHLVQVYCLFDKAAGFFNRPYTSTNVPETELLVLKRSAMQGAIQYPNDIDLYLVGVFDTNSGRFAHCQTYQVGSLDIGDFARQVNVPEKGEKNAHVPVS